MSATVIAQLNACAEIPGMPPFAIPADGLADTGEGAVPAPTDFPSADLSEAGPLPTDLAEAIEGKPAPVDLAPTADPAAISADIHAPGGEPDLRSYRNRTVALLRRYMRLSIQVGRMPSLLGREFFRTRVTAYKSSTFEDSVIFVADVERGLDELNEFEKQLIAKVVLQEYSKEEAGRLLGCGYRTVERLFPEALDRVSEIFLKREILTGPPRTKREVPKTCQEGKRGHFPASD